MKICCYEIQEYLYCPRQYYYKKNFKFRVQNNAIEKGRFKHKLKSLQEIYCEYGLLKGKIDLLKNDEGELIVVEFKSKKSERLWVSDKYQIIAYLYLLKKNDFNVNKGLVHYLGNDKIYHIIWEDKYYEEIEKLIHYMSSLKKVPERESNKSKCRECDMKEYCWI